MSEIMSEITIICNIIRELLLYIYLASPAFCLWYYYFVRRGSWNKNQKMSESTSEVASIQNHYKRIFLLHLPGSCSLLHLPGSCSLLPIVLLLLLLVVTFSDKAAEMKIKKYLKVRLKLLVYITIIREFSFYIYLAQLVFYLWYHCCHL